MKLSAAATSPDDRIWPTGAVARVWNSSAGVATKKTSLVSSCWVSARSTPRWARMKPKPMTAPIVANPARTPCKALRSAAREDARRRGGRFAQGVQRGLDRRNPLQVGCGDRVDGPARGRRDRQGDDVGVTGATQDQVGDQRHSQTLGDQAQDGDVVLGLERHVGREPDLVAKLQQVTATTRTAGDPRLVAEQGQVGDTGAGH